MESRSLIFWPSYLDFASLFQLSEITVEEIFLNEPPGISNNKNIKLMNWLLIFKLKKNLFK